MRATVPVEHSGSGDCEAHERLETNKGFCNDGYCRWCVGVRAGSEVSFSEGRSMKGRRFSRRQGLLVTMADESGQRMYVKIAHIKGVNRQRNLAINSAFTEPYYLIQQTYASHHQVLIVFSMGLEHK
ncbi:hypothetical protein Salat_1131000 [Sesamum alatum]|uniref:Uncharacterized protein n=1 Tax=Sesamum alatum TaxID=300844 RepID=A0AAE2CNE9_9LAMI|nr:hypothetical protein Salat_1131000 [Sesamum alatum]